MSPLSSHPPTEMVKPIFLAFALLNLLGFALKCRAATYVVGDSSGWDISTSVDSWAQDKHFVVGDVLLFQYASSHSVMEVNRDSYQGCKTTNVLQTGSNGNTTFALNKPGDRYFICGNKLHCYAGMKLHILVKGNDKAPAPGPAEAPQAEAGGASATAITTNPYSSKSDNNPSSIVHNSAMFVHVGLESVAFASFTCVLSWIF